MDNDQTKEPVPGSLERVVRPLSEMQTRLMELIRTKGLNNAMSTTDLAWRGKTSRLAVHSSMSSLEKKGMVVQWRSGNDQWAALTWSLTEKGEAA